MACLRDFLYTDRAPEDKDLRKDMQTFAKQYFVSLKPSCVLNHAPHQVYDISLLHFTADRARREVCANLAVQISLERNFLIPYQRHLVNQ